MKKPGIIALGIGLALALSGCLVVIAPPEVSGLAYRTSWVRTSDNVPVICDNRNTTVEYSFKYTSLSDINNWTEEWTGKASSQFNFTATRNANSSGVTVDTASKTITVTRTFSPGTSPYSVAPQSIDVTPINPPPTSQTGEAYLQLTFNVASGTIRPARIVLPVYSGCP
ncbi:MAG: hypothetical protein HZB27_09325 [Meiothermus silvanus]|nr:hypothetical protein [Allomeiothermus silvanus]